MESFEQLARLVQRLKRASGESPFVDFNLLRPAVESGPDVLVGFLGSESPVSTAPESTGRHTTCKVPQEMQRKRRIRATLLSTDDVSKDMFSVNPAFSAAPLQADELLVGSSAAVFEKEAGQRAELLPSTAAATPRRTRKRTGITNSFQKPGTPPAGRFSPQALSPLLRLGSSHSMTSPGDGFLAELLSAEVPITAKLASSQIKDDLVPLSVHASGANTPIPGSARGDDSPGAPASTAPPQLTSTTPDRAYPAPRALDFSPEALAGTGDSSVLSSGSLHRERRAAMAALAARHAAAVQHSSLYALLKTAAEALTLHPSAVLLPGGQEEPLLEATEAHVWALHVLLQLTPVLRLLPVAVLHSIAAHPCIRHMCAPLVQAVLRQGQAQDSAVVPFPAPSRDGGVRVAEGLDTSGRNLFAPRARFGSMGAGSSLPASPTLSPSPPPAPPSNALQQLGGSPQFVRSVSDAGTSAPVDVAFDPDAAEESEVARHASISVQFVGAAEGTDPLEQSRHLHRTREATAALMNRTRVKDTIQGLVRSHAAARSAFSSQSHAEYSDSFLASASGTVQSLPSANMAWFAELLLGMLASVAPAGTDLTHADSAVASMGSGSDAARLAKLNERMADLSPAQAAAGVAVAGLQRIGKTQQARGSVGRNLKGVARRGSGGDNSRAPAASAGGGRAGARSSGKHRTKLTPVTAQQLDALSSSTQREDPPGMGLDCTEGPVPSVAHWLGKESVMQGGRRVAGSVRFFQALAAATHGYPASHVLQATAMRCVRSLSVLGWQVDHSTGRQSGAGGDTDAWCWGAACAQALAVACASNPALEGVQTIMACASSARAVGALLAVLHAPALRAWAVCAPPSTEQPTEEPVCMLGFAGMLQAAADTGSLCVLVPALLSYLRSAQHILASEPGAEHGTGSLLAGATGETLHAVQGALWERMQQGHVLPVTRSHLAVWLELQALPTRPPAVPGPAAHSAQTIRAALLKLERCGLDGTFAALGMLGLRNAFPDLTSIHHKLSRLPLTSRAGPGALSSRDRKDSSGSLGSGFGQRKKIRPVLISVPGQPSALSGIAEHSGGTGVSAGAHSLSAEAFSGKPATTAKHGVSQPVAHVLLSTAFQSQLVHGYLHRHSHVAAISDSVAPPLALSCVKHSMPALVEATCRSALKMFHDEITSKLQKATATEGHAVRQLPPATVDGVWTLAVASAQKAAKHKVRTACEGMFLSSVQVAVSVACSAPGSVLVACDCPPSKCSPASWARGVAALTATQHSGAADASWTEARVAGQVAARQSLSKLDNAVSQLVPVHTARRLAAERSIACKQYWLPKDSDA